MKPVARLGDLHQCPKHKHGTTAITQVAGNSTDDGRPIACVGDKTACGATIIEGSSTAFIDGRAVAYVGCKTDHGGVIITGSSTAKVQS